MAAESLKHPLRNRIAMGNKEKFASFTRNAKLTHLQDAREEFHSMNPSFAVGLD